MTPFFAGPVAVPSGGVAISLSIYAGYVLPDHRTRAAFGKEVLFNRVSAMVYLLEALILVLLTSLVLQDSI